jgi:hypothetical protein
MKYIKSYINIKESNDIGIEDEILSKNDNWLVLKPKFKHWRHHLRKELIDGVYIDLIQLSGRNDQCIYMSSDNNPDLHFISNYKVNYSELYTNIDDNYNRMIKICTYLIPFFTKYPSYSLIEDIKEIFIDISDLNGEPEIKWGYINFNDWLFRNDIGYFPAFRHSDKLKLFLIYYDFKKSKTITTLELFNNHKDKLKVLDLDYGLLQFKEDLFYIQFDI